MAAITTDYYLKLSTGRKTLGVEEFCQLWIPKLYGLYPEEYGYRKACIVEMVRLLEGAVAFNSIDKNWKWLDGQTRYPEYVRPMLKLADQRYKIMEALGLLPRYTIDPHD